MYDENSVLALLAIWGFIALIIFIVALVMYILTSIGLYKLALNQRIENPWLAWIPIGNLYILGKIIKTLKIDTLEIPSIELVLPIGCVVVAILGGIPFIGWIVRIAYMILCFLAMYKLYKMYRPQQAVAWLILSIVLPFMGPIFIFVMRNDTLVEQ
jgi:hypothetical protein